VFYIFLTDFRNLEGIFGITHEGSTISSPVIFICYILTFRNVVIYRYTVQVVLCSMSLFMYMVIFYIGG
jgi:hypothetical protein